MLVENNRTAPNRWVSQPVSGTDMALATPKLVITQVPWFGLTPRSPAMAGMETLAIEESSTFIKVANDRARVPKRSWAPLRGVGAGGAEAPPTLPVVSGVAGFAVAPLVCPLLEPPGCSIELINISFRMGRTQFKVD